jgi:hypothetical protein
MKSWQQLLGNMTLLLTVAGVVISLSLDNTKNEDFVVEEFRDFKV